MFWVQQILGPKNLVQEKLRSRIILGPKKLLVQKIFESKKIFGTYVSSLVKIRSERAEILVEWAIVARTNIAWTNVTVTVGICF